MCNNPYMLLSHYEILACGTALWKLLHLTVFAQGLLINSPFEWRSVSQADSTCQWWERDRERKVDWTREAGCHSSITIYRVTISSPLVQRQGLSLFLSFWLDGATAAHHITVPNTMSFAASTSFLSSHTSFQPTATSFTPAVLASLLVSQPTFLPRFTGPYHSTPTLTLMAYEQSIVFTLKKKEKETVIQIQTSIFA